LGDAVIVTVPIQLPSVANARLHWAAKARLVKSQRHAVGWLLGNKPRPPFPVVVTITRVGPRLYDRDNNVACQKSVIDAIAVWLGVDDRDARVSWIYEQRKGKPACVEIRIVSTIAPLGDATGSLGNLP
jgi:hypothetical protein